MTTMKKFKRWDEYVKEAQRSPFELPISDDHTIIVEVPTGELMLQITDAWRTQDIRRCIRLLCGDQANELFALFKNSSYEAMNNLVTDMLEHFGLDLGMSPGESQASSR